MRYLPLLLALWGCGGGEPDAERRDAPLNTDAPSEAPVPTWSEAALVRSIQFVGAEGGVTEGFDLDSVVSDGSDAAGCGHADLVDGAGVEGIDNAFASLVPVLMATEASALEDLIRQSIVNGELMLVLDVSGPEDDPEACVDLTLWRGTDPPLLGADGTVLDGQTVGVTDPVTVSCVPVVDGVVEARGFALELPVQVLDVDFTLHLQDVAIRAEMRDGVWVGVLGAGIPLSDFDRILSEEDIRDLAELLAPVVANLADLYPDAEGNCQAVSTSLAFEALPAFVEPAE